jgi:hypothetical protein
LVDDIRLSLIDDSNRRGHFHLTAEDVCYYLFEYTSHRDYSFSTTNNLISNLKKKPSQASQPGFHYNARAITTCGQSLGHTLHPNWLGSATLVPVPCSKATGHPDHDDRVEQICRMMRHPPPDVRNLVVQTQSTNASHEVGPGERVTVEELLEVYRIDEAHTQPTPRAIGVVDDVLTAGTHYRAMHTILSQRFPGTQIVGIFVARRVFPNENLGPTV